MGKILGENEGDYVILKSSDWLPELGHDLDFLVPNPSQFKTAKSIMIDKLHGNPQELTHCDKLVAKFSCFLPGFTHDFEIYPNVSQLGEQYFDPNKLFSLIINSHVQATTVQIM